MTGPLVLPPLLARRAALLGRAAGQARKAGLAYERCPWSLADASPTRSRQAAAWFQAFGDAAGLPDRDEL